jgi:hypothetical protein
MLIERLFPVWGVWIYYGAAVGLLLIISVKLGLWLRKAEREYKIEQARRELVGAEVAIRAGLAEGNIYTAWGLLAVRPTHAMQDQSDQRTATGRNQLSQVMS